MSAKDANSGEFTCRSGAVFQWKREETPGVAGVLSGHFRDRASLADVDEVQTFLRTLVPDGGTVEFCQVLDGATLAEAKQRTMAITDQLLGRASRN